MKHIYLDHAAATPMRPEVQQAMLPYLDKQFYNPSSLYQAARAVKADLEQARSRVARVLGAKPPEIIFTAGATESINLALQGVSQLLPGQIVASVIEHEAVLACLAALKASGHAVALVPVKPNGLVEPSAVAAAISDQTILVSIMYANNEIGTVQPLSKIAAVIKTVRADRQKRGLDRPIYLHSDASQAAAYLDLSVARLGVDLMTINAGKIYGPKQTGVLYARTGTKLAPLIHGGGQERGLRSGTENVANAIGLATALELAQAERPAETKRLNQLRDDCLSELTKRIQGLTVNGDMTNLLPNNLNVSLPGVDGETAVLYLDQAGIQAATGAACSAADATPSHVLLNLGLSQAEANASLRFSFGRITDQAAVDQLVTTLPRLVTKLQQLDQVNQSS